MHYSSKSDSEVELKLSGRFDFSAFRSFRDLYEPVLDKSDIEQIAVNFSAVDYLDSAALGMLLLLRDKAGKSGKKVVLTGCGGSVLTLLEVANFGRLFEML